MFVLFEIYCCWCNTSHDLRQSCQCLECVLFNFRCKLATHLSLLHHFTSSPFNCISGLWKKKLLGARWRPLVLWSESLAVLQRLWSPVCPHLVSVPMHCQRNSWQERGIREEKVFGFFWQRWWATWSYCVHRGTGSQMSEAKALVFSQIYIYSIN